MAMFVSELAWELGVVIGSAFARFSVGLVNVGKPLLPLVMTGATTISLTFGATRKFGVRSESGQSSVELVALNFSYSR